MSLKDNSSKFNIPFSDLSLIHKKIHKDLGIAIKSVFERGDYILGRDVCEFEKEFARYCGSKYSVGVSSGTDALFLSLKSFGIGPGDEVIVPAYTYVATANAVSYTDAKIIFVDIQEDSYNIDIKCLKKSITKKTKAIIPVHLYGQSADMSPILALSKEKCITIIEDAAQAHGGVYLPLNKKCGTMGDVGCFSFYPSKNLGAYGDAGMVITKEESIYKKLLKLRDCGRISKYEHEIIGYNARLDTIQAAILRIKLRCLDELNNLRRQAAGLYSSFFRSMPEVKIPIEKDYARHVYHVYAIRVKNRDRLVERLKNKGVSCLVHYPIPLHLQPAYKSLGYKKKDFPIAEKVANEIISLPMFPYITKEQIKFVVDAIKESL